MAATPALFRLSAILGAHFELLNGAAAVAVNPPAVVPYAEFTPIAFLPIGTGGEPKMMRRTRLGDSLLRLSRLSLRFFLFCCENRKVFVYSIICHFIKVLQFVLFEKVIRLAEEL